MSKPSLKERHALLGLAHLALMTENDRLRAALQSLLDEPYGCPLCDCGRPRNPAKGHTDDCPYEIARAALDGSSQNAPVTAQDGSGAVGSFLGTCTRCGQPLNNVMPGYSIVAGGAAVCHDCLGADDDEVLRAR